MKYVDPPFALGETMDGTDDNSNLINDHWLGQIFEHQAYDYSAASIRGSKARTTGRTITAVILRNTSGIALLGKRIGILDTTAGYGMLENCIGYSDTLLQDNIVIIDEWLDSNGVADDDLFWGILAGPVKVLVPLAGADYNGDIAVGNQLVAATGTTTGATTAGRVSNVTLPGQTGATQAFSAAHNIIGVALSAKTTQQTTAGQDVLINACIKY